MSPCTNSPVFSATQYMFQAFFPGRVLLHMQVPLVAPSSPIQPQQPLRVLKAASSEAGQRTCASTHSQTPEPHALGLNAPCAWGLKSWTPGIQLFCECADILGVQFKEVKDTLWTYRSRMQLLCPLYMTPKPLPFPSTSIKRIMTL